MDSLKRLYFIITFSIITLVAIVFVVIFPLLNKTRAASEEYKQVKQKIFEVDQKISLLTQYQSSLNEVWVDFQKIQDAFLTSESLTEFIADLEEVASKTNSFIEIQSVIPPKENQPYFIFKIFLKGEFSNLIHFLLAIENVPSSKYRLIEIDELNFKRGSESSEKKLDCFSTIKVYSEEVGGPISEEGVE